MPGRLFLVATPIGNLADVTARAREVLAAASFVVCEDTRRSRVLMDSLGLRRELVSLPAFAEGERAGGIVERIAAGEDAALVTDAGSPGISDPGEKLVSLALAAQVQVVPIPGPTALVAALSASGLPTGRFHFLGFLPRKGPERKAMIEEVAPLSATLVLYESAQRVGETLAELLEAWGPRRACLARELTKAHEEFVRGSLAELAERYRSEAPRGELVLLVEGRVGEARWSEEEVRRALERGLARGEKLKALSVELARQSGWPAQQLYRMGLSGVRS